MSSNVKSIDIPELFYSSETKSLISTCQVCHADLLKNDQPYLVEKIMKRYNNQDFTTTLFELALCFPCAEEMRNSLSEKSKKNMMEYFLKHSDLLSRKERFLQSGNFTVEDWISKCIFTGQEIDAVQEYHLFAHCQGDKLIMDLMPYMVSFEAEDEMQELLSEETKGEIDNFMKKNFSFPPEFEDVFKTKPILIV